MTLQRVTNQRLRSWWLLIGQLENSMNEALLQVLLLSKQVEPINKATY